MRWQCDSWTYSLVLVVLVMQPKLLLVVMKQLLFVRWMSSVKRFLKSIGLHVPIYDDVRTLDAARLGRIDICTFGFPCQPVSQAGLQKAESDDRWLWDEIIRILQVSKPKWIIAENVVGLISIQDGLLIEHCISSLEAEGYEIQSVVIPACAKNAPHRRSRIWLIGQLTTNTNDTGNRTSRS
jgi:DNA (cytosine-5)-methyltransferase 1